MTGLPLPSRDEGADAGQLARVTALAHQHLGLDVAYVAELVGERLIYRAVAGDGASFGIALGDGLPAESTYCQRLVDGTLPGVIADTRGDRLWLTFQPRGWRTSVRISACRSRSPTAVSTERSAV